MLNRKQKNKLKNLSRGLNRKRKEGRKLANEYAKKHNIKIKDKTKDNQEIELIELDDDGTPQFFITENKEGGELINTDKVYPDGGAGYSLTGDNQILGIWDAGEVRTSHQELQSRVVLKNWSMVSNHATHVGGTMIAAGVVSNARGMSHEATLHSYHWDGDVGEMTYAASEGLKVSQHSYGRITGWVEGDFLNQGEIQWYWFGNRSISETVDYKWGFYNNNSKNWDIISYSAPEYLIVKSAGNDRGKGPEPGTYHWIPDGMNWYFVNTVRDVDGGSDGYKCISHEGLAKNIITVGAVTNNALMPSFSAWGPTNDGRIKPDIVAKGVNVYSSSGTSNNVYAYSDGTSMSGPMISGSIGIILNHQKDLYPDKDLLSSTIKALILHTADDTISGSEGPNYERGWGLMNTKKIIDLMSNNYNNGDDFNIRELLLNNHETIEISVTSKTVSEPLIATICWIDPSGTPTSPQLNPLNLMLINDLDFCIVDENEKMYEPYILDPEIPSEGATRGDNFRDNIEKIVISDPVPNHSYKIIITHKNNLLNDNYEISSQMFSLIISGIE